MNKIDWSAKGIDISRVRGGKTVCPNCSHIRKHRNDPCLSVNIETGQYNCHNDCGFKGSAMVYEKPKKEYTKPIPRLQKVSDRVISWFEGRGISNNTLLRFGVTEAAEWMPQTQSEQNCICFNYYRGDELINIKFRDGAKNFKLAKDAEMIFYNLNSILNAEYAVICEGEIDCLSLHESGEFWAVSVPNGASKGNSRLEYLDNCHEYFDNIPKIIIATDADKAGLSLRDELCRRIGKEKCLIVSYPDGCKDANEVLLKYGKESVKLLISNAQPLPIEGIIKAEDVCDDIMNFYYNGYPVGEKLGISDLDEHITWRDSELTIISGAPGSGKSTWLNNILVGLAYRHNWRIASFSPEKSPVALMVAELAEIKTGKTFYYPYAKNQMSPDELMQAMEFINNSFFFMKIDEIDVTIEGILNKAEELVKRFGINALVIDPWNYVEHKVSRGMSETQYISEALTMIKRFKDRLGVHVFIVAHPTKIKKINGVLDVPSLYDISGSAHFFNKADNGIIVYRNMATLSTEIHIQKIRWSFVGKLGTVQMKYDITNKTFYPINN